MSNESKSDPATSSPSLAERWAKPAKVDKATAIFGPSRISEFLPRRDDLPEDFRRQRNDWCDFVQSWFFKGTDDSAFVPKPGIDKTQALGHLSACMRSFEPKHEHKISGVAYLASLWFEPLTEAAIRAQDERKMPDAG